MQADEFQVSSFLKKLYMKQKQVVSSLVSIYFDSLNLAYNKNKLFKTLDY